MRRNVAHYAFSFAMSELLAPNDLVLVAIMPTPRDLEIARLLGWYRVPLRSAPRVVAVDQLAFYQPASFPEAQKWSIEMVAPLRGHELVTRAELLKDQGDHPRAREEYFKLQLGPLRALPKPIPAGKWKRITFFYTTGERVLEAKSIDDLSVQDEERQMLWRALRERALASQQYGVDGLPEFPFDPEILALFAASGAASKSDESSS